jgi:hypothetical protein
MSKMYHQTVLRKWTNSAIPLGRPKSMILVRGLRGNLLKDSSILVRGLRGNLLKDS